MNKSTYKVTSDKSELLTMEQAQERYQLGEGTIRKRADECGAALKIGRNKRFVKSKMDAYLMSFEA